jgi:PDZ domain
MSGQTNSWTLFILAMAVIGIGSENQAQAQLFRRFTDAAQPEAKNPKAKPDPKTASAIPKTAQAARSPNSANQQSNNRGNVQQPKSPVNAPKAYRPQPNQQQRATPNTGRPQTNGPQARQQQPQAGANAAKPNSRTGAPRAQAPYPQQTTPLNSNAGPLSGSKNPVNAFGQSMINQPKSILEKLGPPEQRTSDRENEPAAQASSSQPPNIEQPKAISTQELHRLFGMTLAEQDDAVLVKQLQESGNAATAGLLAGDSIVSIGGAPIANQRELGEIAGLLSQGDQIEMVVNRDGKEEKLFVQFGQSDNSNVNQADNPNNPNESNLQLGETEWSSTPADESERLKQLVSQQQQVIFELQKRIRELEQNQGSAKF